MPRVAEVVFVKQIDADFQNVEKKDLSKTKPGEGGFSSTGISVIKKSKIEDDLEITSEEATMEVNDKITLVEKVTNYFFFRFINGKSTNVNWRFYIWLLS